MAQMGFFDLSDRYAKKDSLVEVNAVVQWEGSGQHWSGSGAIFRDAQKDTGVEAFLEQLIEHGPNDIAGVFARAFDPAMRIERERFLDAGHHERTANRQGYANGTKPKRIDTPAGTVTVQVPKTAGHDGAAFHPQSLERGRLSVRAVMLAVAGMYINGVSPPARSRR